MPFSSDGNVLSRKIENTQTSLKQCILSSVRFIKSLSPFKQSILSVATILSIFLGRMAFDIPPSELDAMLFLPAIILSNASGRFSGLITTILSSFLSYVYFFPVHNFDQIKNIANLMVFIGSTFGASILINVVADAYDAEKKDKLLEREKTEEKNILLKEMTHRVKNDLQRLSAIISLQTRGASDETKDALKMVISRITTIAKLHEKLEIKNSNVIVKSNELLQDLVNCLLASTASSSIQVILESEDHSLDVNQAGIVGLLTNELLTNSFKHAFPNDREGKITISFTRKHENYQMVISDTGIGYMSNATKNEKSNGGLGQKLMNSLILQIQGNMQISSVPNEGTKISISFPAT